ncbi:ABC transporter permease subunit [Cryobacterium sp. PH31-O1]|uniref:ABC transporter permease subunit n=1 Tax=Cryobacterium sp. PH31-O1 TaxID=3046306 RepID=UPI0024B9750E|nr:ABC transporter permease subunit [Cryobacterium sp. PH31-O1]MDJ0339273.1 ABC transporter permease subunit [Cryobacterium sp. PH31-O1]
MTAVQDRARNVRRAPLPLFGKVFTDSWRGLLGWALGLAAAAFLYLPLYPSISGGSGMQDIIKNLPPELIKTLNYDQIGTGAGYAQATVFGLIGFVLMTIAATSWGAGALGGDEESGRLELTLAHGVTRVQVAAARFCAIAVKILALSTLTFLAVLTLNDSARLEIQVENLLGTSLMFGGVSLLTASVALLGGALSGRRIGGIAAGAGVAVVGYIFNALGNQSASLEWLHNVSPYYWAFGNSPLSTGADPTTIAVFYALSLLLAATAALALRQRDIGV